MSSCSLLMGCTVSLFLSALFPLSYVGLLHVFDRNGTDRNAPASVRKRFAAALLNNVFAVGTTWLVLRKNEIVDPLSYMGLRLDGGSLNALLFPALLTGLLYLGQWLMMYYDGQLGGIFDLSEWRRSFRDVTWVRDAIVAPITEEIAFRACSASLMTLCLSDSHTIFVAPLFFALSHFHHIGDDRRKGFTVTEAILRRSFQFLYTYTFGTYATYLFLSTRHVIAPIVTHSICNILGLPLINEIGSYTKKSQRISLWIAYVLGFAGFATFVAPLTQTKLYAAV